MSAQEPPPSGVGIIWRFRTGKPVWKYGFVRYEKAGMIGLGYWTGDVLGGPMVCLADIEWRPEFE